MRLAKNGRVSTLAMFDGHPFDIQSRAKYVLINGEIVHQE